MDKLKIIGCLLLACLVAGALYAYAAPFGFEKAVTLATTGAVAVLWITTTFPLAVTAMLVPVFLLLGGVLPLVEVGHIFLSPILFLMLGGYIMAVAIEKTGVALWLTQWMLQKAERYRINGVTAFMLTSAILSMFISNTATVALLIPMVIHALNLSKPVPHLATVLMLSVAYGASIGGVATLIGSPPNAIAGGLLNIGFAEWLKYGMPVSIVMLFCSAVLLRFLLPCQMAHIDVELCRQRLSLKAKGTLVVIACVVFLWLFGPLVAQELRLPPYWMRAHVIALVGSFVLLLMGCFTPKDIATKVNWPVLVLIAGGLVLGQGMIVSGTSEWLAQGVASAMFGYPVIVFLIVVVTVAIFATEIISNTAVAANLAPVVAGVALHIGVPEPYLVVPVVIATSMAFMLPVATPPNALVHATKHVTQREMMRVGFWLNILAIVVIIFVLGVLNL